MLLLTWKQALKQTFTDPHGWSAFLVSSFGLFFLLLLIPVWTTPGNNIFFQIHLLGWQGTLLVATLSVGNGLLLTMQSVILRKQKTSSAAKKVVKATTLTGILAGSITATIACAACYSSILSLLGLGTTIFIVEHRMFFAIVALSLTLGALHYSARRLNNACAVCHS